MPATRNVTLSLNEEILREARVIAAHEGLSVSALLRRELLRLVEDQHGFARARRAALKRLARGRSLGGGRLPSRDELHDRAELR